MKVNFDNYSYYPALRTRAAEITGLSNLAQDKKEKILPLISLGKWPRSEEIQASLDKSFEAMNNLPFILDVTKESSHHCTSSFELLSQEGGFKNWIEFCSQSENIIPVVQMPDSAKLRDISIQARTLEEENGSVAFRIRNLNTDINKTLTSLVSMRSPENAITFIDLGYIRGNISAITAAAINSINQIRTEIPEAIISVLATSFPSSVANFCRENGQSGYIDILERELHQNIGGRDVSIYGDHGSIHSVVYDNMIGRYVPRIDIALDDAWYFERRPGQNKEGFVDAAKSILTEYPQYQDEKSWGALMIRNAASGDINGMGSPAKWIAVRVNLHLNKQIDLSEALKIDFDSDEDFF
ncbi:beta family protein [Buttiauxella ferragutiae]|uniref:beta family protein n=1 Tax=Buttiauxella ferragutiae TaxID=82989 RepID=UPI003526573A